MVEESNKLKIQTDFKVTQLSNWKEIRTSIPHPPRRSYHSSVIWEDNMIVIGGQDLREGSISDIWSLSSSRETWSKMPFELSKPLYRSSAILFSDKILVYGGTSGYEETSDLHIIDLLEESIQLILSSGPLPPASDSHTANLYRSTMIVFGGFSYGRRTNKLLSLDLESLNWQSLSSINAPPPLSNHSSVVSKDKMYIFGGTNEDSDNLNEVWKLDLEDLRWDIVECTGQVPSPRAGHSAIVYKNLMIIFGGMRAMKKESNEMFSLDLESGWWTMFQLETDVQDTISYRHLEEYKKTKLPRSISLNGISTTGHIIGQTPHSRDGHSAVLYAESMVIFGGDRNQIPFNDVYVYELKEDIMRTPANYSPEKII